MSLHLLANCCRTGKADGRKHDMSRLGGRRGGRMHHIAASKQTTLFPRQGLRCRENSGFSTLNIAKETFFIDLTLCEHGNGEENGSLTVVTCWHLHVYPFFSIFSAGDRFELNWWKNASHSSIRNKTLFPRQGLRCRENSGFSTLNIAKETFFIDLTLCENGNCEENGSLTVVTCWHLHVYPFFSIFSAGDRFELNWWKNASHSSIRTKTLFPTQGLRCLENSGFLSFQHCQGGTIHWPDPLRIWKLWREWFVSQWSLADTCMRVFLLNWIGGRMSHQLARLARHWTKASACSFSMAKFFKCSTHSCSNRNRQCDS